MTFLGREGVKVLPKPTTVSSVQDGMSLCARRSPYPLHPAYETFLLYHLQCSSDDDGPFSVVLLSKKDFQALSLSAPLCGEFRFVECSLSLSLEWLQNTVLHVTASAGHSVKTQ